MRQSTALAILQSGVSAFLTGEPGSGKTHTINAFVSWLREHGVEPGVTASTGIAATHIGGVTIHAWSGVGIRDTLTDTDIRQILSSGRVKERIKKTSVLIIDEISMLSADTLDLVERMCRAVRENDDPFGGIQVVFVGDFFQLPPIIRRKTDDDTQLFADERPSIYAFESRSWQNLDPVILYLSEQHRQEDHDFLGILSAIRQGKVAPRHRSLLAARRTDREYTDDTLTRLYSHNANVDEVNARKLGSVPGKERTFLMKKSGNAALIEVLMRSCLSPEKLVLKIGARVMFTKNDPDYTFVNGTTGEVIDFVKMDDEQHEGEKIILPLVKTSSGEEILVSPVEWKIEDRGYTLATIAQIPLRLAWAITIHKSQGMSLDRAHIDLSSAFEFGQGYVALSRVRSLSGLTISGINDRALQVHPDIRERDVRFRGQSDDTQSEWDQYSEEEKQKRSQDFLIRIGGYLEAKSGFRPERREKQKKPKEKRYLQTLALLEEGHTLAQIAEKRSRTLGTILSHLEEVAELGKLTDAHRTQLREQIPSDAYQEIVAILNASDSPLLAPAFEKLAGKYPYETIRIVRLAKE